MKLSGKLRTKRVLSAIIVTVICLFCVILLAACDSGSKKPTEEDRDYFLYIGGYIYSDEDSTVIAVLKMSSSQDGTAVKLDENAHWHIVNFADDIWFNKQNVEIAVDGAKVYDSVRTHSDGAIFENDGKTYNFLKVALRYDTIYKSIKSDGKISKTGRYYSHTFDINETEQTQTFGLHLRTQNSASWYSVLIAGCILLAIVLIGATSAIKGGVWQKKKNE